MENKHTAGEWEIVTDLEMELYPTEIFIAVKNDKGIFEHPICNAYLSNNKDGKANANLISAAPDMLEALQTVLSFIKDNEQELKGGRLDQCIKEITAAINKATK